MSARHPSRIALAVFDYCVSNDPLRGDLLEEFHVRGSQLWLWRQVIGAVVYQPWLLRLSGGHAPFSILALAMLVLMAFEAVFFINAMQRSVFGPPVQDIRGYAYFAPLWFHSVPPPPARPTSIWMWLVPLFAVASSFPLGWWIARIREQHRVLALAAFSCSVVLCVAANLHLSLWVQLVTCLVFLLGLLSGGTLEATVEASQPPSSTA